MKCPKCVVGRTLYQPKDGGKAYIGDCDRCHGTGEIEMTNEEYIRSCTTEQLAEALLNIMANNEFALYLIHTEKKSVQEIKGAVVEWLKEIHNEV